MKVRLVLTCWGRFQGSLASHIMRAIIRKADAVEGDVTVPGDKSISHRALMLGALSEIPVRLENLAPGLDVQSTADCLRTLGARIDVGGHCAFASRGDSWNESVILDCGNSGTTMRLLTGLIAGLNLNATLVGDASLSLRPMRRIVDPLSEMGARVKAHESNFAPIVIQKATTSIKGRHHVLKLASAQVKSSLLLAGVFAEGMTSIVEPLPTRDHTERMMRAFGLPVVSEGLRNTLVGPWGPLQGISTLRVPGDASSAAFLVGAAVMASHGQLRLRCVGLNSRRTGYLSVLARMGADARIEILGEEAGEPWGDIVVRGGRELNGTEILPDEIPSLIDELPMLAAVATQAHGVTRISGARELRLKESDRIALTVRALERMGAKVTELSDGLSIEGPCTLKGTTLNCEGDHRMAMAYTLLGLVASGNTCILNAEWARISFPQFFSIMSQITHTAVYTEEHI